MKTVRIWFRKTGTAKYISHLDLNRCMARAMRRASIPAWVTEGFNPHLFLTFALPLSLGQEGLCESMDIKLPDDYEPDTLPAQLNAVLPVGLTVTRAAQAIKKPSEIAFAAYELILWSEQAELQTLACAFDAFWNQPEIPVIKKGKAADRTIDLKPYLTGCTPEHTPDGICLNLTLPAGSSENINPSLLTDAFCAQSGLAPQVRIVRQAIYDGARQNFA